MEFNKKIKKELDDRINKVENFIADRGIGSKQLNKARIVQRNMNLAVFVGGLITIAGITIWAMSNNSNKD